MFAQLKPVLGAANPARDAALFSGEELKHPHHHPQAQPAPPHPPQTAPPPAAGPRLPPEELVQVGRSAPLPPGGRACPAAATRGRQGPLQAGRASGRTGSRSWSGQPRPALPAWTLAFRREKVGRPEKRGFVDESALAGPSVKGSRGNWVLPRTFVFYFIWRIKPRTSRQLDLNSAFRLKPPASSGMALELPRPASSRVKGTRKSGCWGGASRGVFLSLGSTCFRRDRGAAFGKPELEKQRLYWSAYFSLKRKLGCCFFHVRVNFFPEPR